MAPKHSLLCFGAIFFSTLPKFINLPFPNLILFASKMNKKSKYHFTEAHLREMIRHLPNEICHLPSEIRHLPNGIWQISLGRWQISFGRCRISLGRWQNPLHRSHLCRYICKISERPIFKNLSIAPNPPACPHPFFLREMGQRRVRPGSFR